MIEKMLQTHTAMAVLFNMLHSLVSEAERTYCASGKAEDRQRWEDMMQSRSSLVESMVLFGRACGMAITTYGELKKSEHLNANSEAL